MTLLCKGTTIQVQEYKKNTTLISAHAICRLGLGKRAHEIRRNKCAHKEEKKGS